MTEDEIENEKYWQGLDKLRPEEFLEYVRKEQVSFTGRVASPEFYLQMVGLGSKDLSKEDSHDL